MGDARLDLLQPATLGLFRAEFAAVHPHRIRESALFTFESRRSSAGNW